MQLLPRVSRHILIAITSLTARRIFLTRLIRGTLRCAHRNTQFLAGPLVDRSGYR